MDQQTPQAIRDALNKSKTIGIAIGREAGIDETAAALSLYLSLKGQNKDVSIASPKEPLVAVSSLVGIDKVKSSLDGQGGDLIVSFPYKEGEIEKVSYTLEDGYLNIVVKAGNAGLTFSQKEVLFKRGNGAPELLFVIGTPRLSDLGNLFNPDSLKNTTIINIDNKNENQGFGEIAIVSPQASSVSEQIASLLRSLDFELDLDVAQNLLSGIADGTGNFQSSKTTAGAFEMAAFLMKKGAKRIEKRSDREEVPRDQFFNPRPRAQQRQYSQGFQNQARPFDFPGKARTQQQPASVRGEQGQGARAFPKPQQQPPIKQQAQQNPDEEEEEAPSDWLAPKVYKGSTLV